MIFFQSHRRKEIDAWDETGELLSTFVTRDKKVHTQQENLLKKHI